MIFKKLFSKDCRFYLAKGERYLAEERYADARHAFQEGLRKLAGEPAGNEGLEAKLGGLLDETGNRLGKMNLEEAEHALARKEFVKAEEHLDLALELATDAAIRESARKLRERVASGPPAGASEVRPPPVPDAPPLPPPNLGSTICPTTSHRGNGMNCLSRRYPPGSRSATPHRGTGSPPDTCWPTEARRSRGLRSSGACWMTVTTIFCSTSWR